MQFQPLGQISIALALLLGAAGTGEAQDAVGPSGAATSPAPSSPVQNYAAPSQAQPLARQGEVELHLSAQLVDGGPYIDRGMNWRVFEAEPGKDGKLPMVASAQGGPATFTLKPGSYLVHAAFGRAGATKRIAVGTKELRDKIVLDAGGLQLNAAVAGGNTIAPGKLTFAIYEGKQDAAGNRVLVVPDIKPNTVVRLNEGDYNVVSNYGTANAVVRSDLHIDAGKLTEATIELHAAQITLKLVREAGGQALAETSWTVVNDAGDPVSEVAGPYATLVLAEGNYTVLAKNRDRVYQHDFTVESGKDSDVEVAASDENAMDPDEGAD